MSRYQDLHNLLTLITGIAPKSLETTMPPHERRRMIRRFRRQALTLMDEAEITLDRKWAETLRLMAMRMIDAACRMGHATPLESGCETPAGLSAS